MCGVCIAAVGRSDRGKIKPRRPGGVTKVIPGADLSQLKEYEVTERPDTWPTQDNEPAAEDTLEITWEDPIASGDQALVGKIHSTCGALIRFDGTEVFCGCGSSNLGH